LLHFNRSMRYLCNTHKSMRYLHIGDYACVKYDIDDRLMREAMRRSGAPTKRAAVEAGYGCWRRRTRKHDPPTAGKIAWRRP